jgi:hypothetical protein
MQDVAVDGVRKDIAQEVSEEDVLDYAEWRWRSRHDA